MIYAFRRSCWLHKEWIQGAGKLIHRLFGSGKSGSKDGGEGWIGEIFRVRSAGSADGLDVDSEEGRRIRTILKVLL